MNIFKKIKIGLKVKALWDWITDQPWKEGLMPEVANGVPVKSAAKSKINWTVGISIVISLLSMFGIDVPAETQAQIQTAIVAVTGIVVWIWRTFFNRTVTPE